MAKNVWRTGTFHRPDLGGDPKFVHVVDDDPRVRETVSRILGAAGFVIFKYASAPDFLSRIGQEDSGCLLLDLFMPGMGGIALMEHLGQAPMPFATLILTGHADVPLAVQAVKAGAVDIIQKPFTKTSLLDGVAKAAAALQERKRSSKEVGPTFREIQHLSAREYQILRMVFSGHSSKEAAKLLGLSPRTVENHRANIMRKMGVKRFSGLAHLSQELHHKR